MFELAYVSEWLHGDLTMSPTSNGPCAAEEISLGLGDILGLEELYQAGGCGQAVEPVVASHVA